MTAALRIAIAGKFFWHSGSSHALLGYVRAGRHLGYDVRASLLGVVDDVVRRKVPIADADWRADLTVLVCEERFMSDDARQQLDRVSLRSRRVLIDPDGRYSPITDVGIDANHADEESRAAWVADFDALSDCIVQPCLGRPAPGTRHFLYFGVDVHRERSAPPSDKPYDVVYVGNNWYRWADMVWLAEGLDRVRNRIGRIAVYGQWWTGNPEPGYEDATASDASFLRDRGVETFPPAAYGTVERTMGLGRLTPILVRPVLSALKHATPRMFESFAAETVPILAPVLRYTSALYGERVAALVLPPHPADAVMAILDRYDQHAALAREIAADLAREHSYEARLAQLIELGLS